MKIDYDEAKRRKTILERGLDFADAGKVFETTVLEYEDDRRDYGERRFISYGSLRNRAVILIWTWRGPSRRIISMRHVHDRELEARRKSVD